VRSGTKVSSRIAKRGRAQVLAHFAIASVVLVGLVASVANFALWLRAQNVVLAAAQEAALVASRADGSDTAAAQRATEFLRAGLGIEARAIEPVRVELDADTVTVELRGTWYVPPMGTLVPVPLHATVRMVREAFRPGGR
jgi:hypothetical protein